MGDGVSIFGVRHHGPGCARSLRTALEELQPDCLLIEGPAGAESLLAHLRQEDLQPPVALLSHSVDDPQLAVFHPFAIFSPEWQALRWASAAGVPVRFMDVPPAVCLDWQRQERAVGTVPVADGEVGQDPDGDVDAEAAVADGAGAANEEGADDRAMAAAPHDVPHDPLDWLARAAGYGDGETWWNHMVEERGDGAGLFEAIAEAMTELRAHAPPRPAPEQRQEDIREAHMRSVLRDARKQNYQRIAVVCGAWHVPALAESVPATADARLLKGLSKSKTQSTWVPWTYRHLSRRSGYGAGVVAPGWYEYLWRSGGEHTTRAVGWYARVARLLREHGLDCSSAHLIEATRLADTLAALRDRPAPGLEEIGESTRSVICNGEEMPMRLIADALLVGEALGSVPPDVPTVPLQRDLEAEQKRLRLKPEALQKALDLDLRNETDLQRSQLLHRLALLDIAWGALGTVGRSARGTFHEVWTLSWEPAFQIELIVASRHGPTVRVAATARAIERALQGEKLSALAALVDQVLLANLPDAVARVAAELSARAALDADPIALLAALPALANVHRYGNVRKTDSAQVEHLFDGMALRACVGLPLALCDLDDEPSEQAREVLLGAHRALELRRGDDQTSDWHRALKLAALSDATSPMLRGLCLRLLFDAGAVDVTQVQPQLQLNLSQGAEPLFAARWLDGFLNRNATVLLHSDDIWQLIDRWLTELGNEHFVRVLPLVRRTFAGFEAADRRDLGQRVRHGATNAPARGTEPGWNEARALRALPMLREYLGVGDER